MIDLFKKTASKGSTVDQASGDNRQAYLQYVEEVTTKGGKAKTYAEWLKERR